MQNTDSEQSIDIKRGGGVKRVRRWGVTVRMEGGGGGEGVRNNIKRGWS